MNEIEKSQFNRPFLGERVSGDLPFFHDDDSFSYAVLIDGIGHGDSAHLMAESIGQELIHYWSPNPSRMITYLNDRLSKNIGAAIGVLVINKNTMKFFYSGLGNIRCKIIGNESTTNLTSTDGILGMRYRSTKNHEGILRPGDLVVLCSDGISKLDEIENWNRFKALKSSTIARRIVNKYGTDLDDSSCIAIKIN
ncbi:SpoIIE family protein phosphatase [Eudoraea adriatica]|uniref:SpoIIE family protein phosphatase n=1 Tax=Eudoraea adriatica TaxID=446681 RepID=UPI0003795A70|nr:SpoIIE family protein phosphatase [Eudoraea adriatica]